MSEQDNRIWDGLSVDARTLLSRALQNAFTGGSGNRVILVDTEGNIVTSLGGGGGGGGKSTYSTSQSDIAVAVNPGTKTFTISPGRFPTVVTEDHIISANFCKVKRTATGLTEEVDINPISVSGNIVTVSGESENFVTGDSIYLKLEGPLKQDDAAQDVQKTISHNPVYAHRTDAENWPLTDQTGISRRIIDMDTYRNLNIQIEANQTGGQTGVFKTYKSNVVAADISSLANWVDCSTGILGAGTLVMAGTGAFQHWSETGPKSPLKYMLELDFTAAAAPDMAYDIYIRKFY